MKLKKFEIALIFALCLTWLVGIAAAAESAELSDKLIRLHVIANSDSEIDQELKLKVRDGILDFAENLEVKDRDDAENIIFESLSAIEKVAEDIVLENGFEYRVQAELCREKYDTRNYDGFSLPAGEYTSLIITIGEGKGKNWWCVLFPPFCLAAAESFEEVAVLGGLSGEEVALITEADEGYIIKFKVIELLERLKSKFSE